MIVKKYLLHFPHAVEMCSKTEVRSSIALLRTLLVNVVLLRSALGIARSQFCPQNTTYIPETDEVLNWTSTGMSKEIVISDPPCTDENDQLVARFCIHTVWEPDFQGCKKTTQNRRCPLNFEETEETCRFISSPRSWGNICQLESISENSANIDLKTELVWLSYRRLKKYGRFEDVTWGKSRGRHFDKPLVGNITDPDFFNKNCLVANMTSNQYFPEFCDKKHRHVCAFNKKEANSKCPSKCTSADVVNRKCYCKMKGYCASNLVKINNIFDLTILKDLVDDEPCYVNSNFDRIGKLQGLNRKAWFFTGGGLKCSLCTMYMLKTSIDINVEMVLNFDEKQRQLFLTIYSPEGLSDNANENSIYCYTDAAQFELKKKVNVDKVLEYRQGARPYNVYEVTLEKFIGHYWCEAYKDISEETKVSSNNVLAYTKKEGNEFSVRLTIKSFCLLIPCALEYEFNYPKIFKSVFLTNLRDNLRVMEIYSFDFVSIDMLLHITTDKKVPVVDDYNEFIKEFENMTHVSISYFKSSEYCLPEVKNNLTWPLTRLGQSAIAEEMCLQENGLPVVRICGGKFLTGAEWGEVLGECHNNIQVPDSTIYIQSTLNQNISNETVANITSVIKSDPNFPVLSVYMVSKFMDTMYGQINNTEFDTVSSTLDITDSLLYINKQSLIYAQELLNVSDDVLDLVDNVLSESFVEPDVLILQRDNLIMHVTNPLISGISGLVVYYYEDKGIVVDNLIRNSTFENISEDALIAMIVPEEIINHRNTSNLTIITTVYLKDSFFESNYTKKPSGPILSVIIPEFGCYLPSTIPILFKVNNYTDEPECGFWDYGKKTTRTKGKWSTVGGNYLGKYENSTQFHICSYSHLTHFSLLRLTIANNLTVTDDSAMDIIFYVGDALTILGVTGIFITAIAFKRWRRKQGTIILLNLSVAILIEVFVMQLTDTKIPLAPQGCGVLGILLHYIIISKFSWMLVYSFLQYMRFVRVLTVLPENIVLKSVIFGWGFALIPVAIVNIITSSAYAKKKYNFCYPTGMYLYLGTLMPVLLIVCINTYVFIVVMKEVTFKNVESHGSKENIHKLQVQLAILLFFVLGVPWLFFVFASLIPMDWLSLSLAYLFCVTSNLQGFILFLFYVVFNGETKKAWANYFSKTRPKSFSISTKTSKS